VLAALLSQHDLAGDQAGPAQESFESTPADLFERNPVVEERAKALWSNVEQKDERKGPLAAGDRGGARARAPARSAPAAERLRWAGAGGSTLAVSGCAALDEGEPAEGAGGRGSFRLVDNLDGLAGRGAALRAPGLVRGFIILAAGGFGALFLR